jgi:hypothetical protein
MKVQYAFDIGICQPREMGKIEHMYWTSMSMIVGTYLFTYVLLMVGTIANPDGAATQKNGDIPLKERATSECSAVEL